MKRYAVLDTNKTVSNIIVAPNLDMAELVTASVCVFINNETGEADIGYTYLDGTFSAPAE
jgi:hypothetical protein